MRRVAQQQGGVITAGQCHVLGATDSDIRRLLGSGEWRRVRRGVYADSRRPSADGHLRQCAAVLTGLTAGTGVVSHLSAARLLGLPLPPRVDSRISITRRPPAPTNGPRSGPAAPLTVHLADYDDADLRYLAGVPVLAGARLVLDCCDAMPADCALAVADAALTRGLTDLEGLQAELRRRRGRPGSRVARLVVERAAPGPQSWFESISRWWLLEAGLPRPQLQVPFPTGTSDRDPAVDMWFAEQRTVGEADGAGKYDEPGSLFTEKLREDWLRDTYGVEVVRWVPREMRTPARRSMVVARFHRAFARGRRTA
ncbi:type IV toxin-antitoxin system AbiEi family antitoxin domain-containing protein [Pseudonocardia sp. DLS-67]